MRRAESGEVVHELHHFSAVHAIAWSPEKRLLASGGDDSEAMVRRAESGEVVNELQHISIVPKAVVHMAMSGLMDRELYTLADPWKPHAQGGS